MNSKFKMNEKTVTTLLYVGAAVLVVAILCVSIFAFVSQSRKKKNPQDTTSNGVVTTEQIPSDNDPVTNQNAQDTQPTPDTSKNTENVSDDDPDEVVFRNPAEGAVAKNHDTETLVYSVTMNDYRVHCGVDIAAAVGTPVYSVADGTITRIYDDYLMGKCIEIDHGNGIVSCYKNLQPELPEGIAEGASVTSGQLIAGVGESAIIEQSDEAHLHFEMMKDGEYVNPLDYLAYNQSGGDM